MCQAQAFGLSSGYIIHSFEFVPVYAYEIMVSLFITINVHAQPLNLRCCWRLVQKRIPQSVMDKRGKAILPA